MADDLLGQLGGLLGGAAGAAISSGSLFGTTSDPFVADGRLQAALDGAIVAAALARGADPTRVPIRFALADITSAAGSFPFAGHDADVTDYVASEAKIAVMFAAYALRHAVRQAAAFGLTANPGELLARFKAVADPIIRSFVGRIATAPLEDRHRLPRYDDVLKVTAGAAGLDVQFTPAYLHALDLMIIPSDNRGAGTCVHGLGYGFLNGALQAAGFFEPAAARGLWVAGDYLDLGSPGKYPAVRVPAVNDGNAAQAGSARQVARLMALIETGRLLDPPACNEMRVRLEKAARGVPGMVFDPPFVARSGRVPQVSVRANKLGVGPLKASGDVWSEVSVIRDLERPGSSYVVAWQNLAVGTRADETQIAETLRGAVATYELTTP